MNQSSVPTLIDRDSEPRAATPVAGAIAGILFAVLFSISTAILILTMADLAGDTGEWLTVGAGSFRFAIALIPFAGLFFMWFMGVARERLGTQEDQFFATVFLGSGLLFLAMVFGATASAGAMAAAFSRDPSGFVDSTTYHYARFMISQIFGVFALRMAAVFVISQATLWLRTSVMPKWMAFTSYAVALVLLFVVSQSLWIVLIFPAWVFLVSVYFLVTHLSSGRTRSA
jgi:hypothetical protein